jgi:hypothetical protein
MIIYTEQTLQLLTNNNFDVNSLIQIGQIKRIEKSNINYLVIKDDNENDNVDEKL